LKLLSWILLLPIVIAAVVLAIANRHAVPVNFDPLPFAYDIPLFAIVLAAIFVGLIIGFTASWLAAHKWRRMARERGRRLSDLERETKRLKAQLATPTARSAPAHGRDEPLTLPPGRADAA
jgi:uncharacterized integral membrane protein